LSAAREAGRPWEPAPAAEARTANEEQLATGIQTNMCCETTARVGANLGFELGFAIDATHTFACPGVTAAPLLPTSSHGSPRRTSTQNSVAS
jgi:nicotinamidase-related amidase